MPEACQSHTRPRRDECRVLAPAASLRPFLESIDELEPKRERLKAKLARLEAEQESSRALASITGGDVTKRLQGFASHLTKVDQKAVKELREGIAERIAFDPDSHRCRIRYRTDTGEFMAPPRGFEPR